MQVHPAMDAPQQRLAFVGGEVVAPAHADQGEDPIHLARRDLDALGAARRHAGASGVGEQMRGHLRDRRARSRPPGRRSRSPACPRTRPSRAPAPGRARPPRGSPRGRACRPFPFRRARCPQRDALDRGRGRERRNRSGGAGGRVRSRARDRASPRGSPRCNREAPRRRGWARPSSGLRSRRRASRWTSRGSRGAGSCRSVPDGSPPRTPCCSLPAARRRARGEARAHPPSRRLRRSRLPDRARPRARCGVCGCDRAGFADAAGLARPSSSSPAHASGVGSCSLPTHGPHAPRLPGPGLSRVREPRADHLLRTRAADPQLALRPRPRVCRLEKPADHPCGCRPKVQMSGFLREKCPVSPFNRSRSGLCG